MTCSLHTSHASNNITKELQPCGTIQDAQHVENNDTITEAPYAKPHQQGSPMCNPGLLHTNVQLTRHADHNPWPWHAPNPATYPKQSYLLQLLKLYESTETEIYLPLQHSQHLQRQPVPYPGAYLVHLAQCWTVQVHAQSVARTRITVQANAPTYNSTMVISSAITN